jgi:hypothetical protein
VQSFIREYQSQAFSSWTIDVCVSEWVRLCMHCGLIAFHESKSGWIVNRCEECDPATFVTEQCNVAK